MRGIVIPEIIGITQGGLFPLQIIGGELELPIPSSHQYNTLKNLKKIKNFNLNLGI